MTAMGMFKRVVAAMQKLVAPVAEAISGDLTPEQIATKLDGMAVDDKTGLQWRTSVVDLLKLLGFDSDFNARKELAEDLDMKDYSGTAEQNVTLHAELLRKLAEHGIKLPRA